MEKQKIAIVGAGPAGCFCAYVLSKYAQKSDITLFDFANPLRTLLPTGGGRCNLANAEFDFKELAKNYPRGEKFLFSVFSRFSTCDTLEAFEKMGIKTYTQDDLRIFPNSNSSEEVREKMLESIKSCKIKREKVLKIEVEEGGFYITTDMNSYHFEKVVISVGGHACFNLAKNLKHKIIDPKPALVGLLTKNNFAKISGVSIKLVRAEVFFKEKKLFSLTDDLLFTHHGVSGPLAYKISSLCARLDYDKNAPLVIKTDFLNQEIDLQELLNSNPKKDIKNLISQFVPKSLADYILASINIDADTKCFQINSKIRDLILKNLKEFEISALSPSKEGEVVTSGGVCLDEINPKTMESKLVKNLYFCGEVIDVDGFCGGFNLQNCWSTAFVAALGILGKE